MKCFFFDPFKRELFRSTKAFPLNGTFNPKKGLKWLKGFHLIAVFCRVGGLALKKKHPEL